MRGIDQCARNGLSMGRPTIADGGVYAECICLPGNPKSAALTAKPVATDSEALCQRRRPLNEHVQVGWCLTQQKAPILQRRDAVCHEDDCG